ncbi:MAG: Na(+)-translocating NADH-quinone reductase subunit A [Bacteroidales bacterium]
MSNSFRLKRGYNIRLKGDVGNTQLSPAKAECYAVKPTDFLSMVPKLTVKVNDRVKAGSPLFFNKLQPQSMVCSPVSGEVVAINRGERRRLEEIVIKTDQHIDYEHLDTASSSAEQIKSTLQKSGLWSFFVQRPYGIIVNPEETPQHIYISCFDSSPLANDLEHSLCSDVAEFKSGVEILKKLTTGKVRLGLNAKVSKSIFEGIDGVEYNRFEGAHPAGNVGVQISKISPLNKGEKVWTISPQAVVYIGRLFSKGIYDVSLNVKVAGTRAKDKGYIPTILGAQIKSLLTIDKPTGKTKMPNSRIISGNILTGQRVVEDGYLGSFHNLITSIPDGDYYKLLGWATPGISEFSVSRTFFGWMCPKRKYNLDTNTHGEERAFVMSGQYEKVLPMDILPVYLLKAILANDIDKMEQLGIYEVIEEDLALCEVICTSKIDVQNILREGINTMITEIG